MRRRCASSGIPILSRWCHQPHVSDAMRFQQSRDTSEVDARATGFSRSTSRGKRSVDGQAPLTPEAIQRDLNRLSYYENTEKHGELLQELREKYKHFHDNEDAYTPEEVAAGLKGEPVDIQRLSPAARAMISQSPQRIQPQFIAQELGVLRYRANAFSAAQAVGTLRDHRGTVLASVLANKAENMVERTTLMQAIRRIDPLQRQQLRHALSDINCKDFLTAFHVMRSYPYAGALSAMLWAMMMGALIEMQKRWKAIELYDDYLGLDLRMAPGLVKPVYFLVALVASRLFISHASYLGAVWLTRAFRIVMRRPIGPP